MTTISLPGLVDPHVHLREPGAVHKEDFDSGTAAALAGGYSAVLAMPNTQPPLVDGASLALAEEAAHLRARCDYAIYLGASSTNASSAPHLASRVCGLKMYLDQTYGPLCLPGPQAVEAHCAAWPKDQPLVAHAEGPSLALVLLLAGLYARPVHICHVSRKEELLLIRRAKERRWRVTCEVTPHHLFLTHDDVARLGPGRGSVRPPLADKSDRDALWENLALIDVIATDHAPHTLAEKDGPQPPPGFPGLETALPLLLSAVDEGRMTLDDLVARTHTHPRRIWRLAGQPDTSVEVDRDARWEVRAADLHSRCGWTPWEGMQLKGRVRRVTLRGKLAYQDGLVLAPPGSGHQLRSVGRRRF